MIDQDAPVIDIIPKNMTSTTTSQSYRIKAESGRMAEVGGRGEHHLRRAMLRAFSVLTLWDARFCGAIEKQQFVCGQLKPAGRIGGDAEHSIGPRHQDQRTYLSIDKRLVAQTTSLSCFPNVPSPLCLTINGTRTFTTG